MPLSALWRTRMNDGDSTWISVSIYKKRLCWLEYGNLNSNGIKNILKSNPHWIVEKSSISITGTAVYRGLMSLKWLQCIDWGVHYPQRKKESRGKPRNADIFTAIEIYTRKKEILKKGETKKKKKKRRDQSKKRRDLGSSTLFEGPQ